MPERPSENGPRRAATDGEPRLPKASDAPQEGAAPTVPFESRIVIQEDGTVIIEHAGEGLESLAAALRGDEKRDPAERT